MQIWFITEKEGEPMAVEHSPKCSLVTGDWVTCDAACTERAEIAELRKVVDAAAEWWVEGETQPTKHKLEQAVRAYLSQRAQRGGSDG
jgi:hypothetical protein